MSLLIELVKVEIFCQDPTVWKRLAKKLSVSVLASLAWAFMKAQRGMIRPVIFQRQFYDKK
jgi:hypothetical protein